MPECPILLLLIPGLSLISQVVIRSKFGLWYLDDGLLEVAFVRITSLYVSQSV